MKALASMPPRDEFLKGLHVVGYNRAGQTAVFLFRYGTHSVLVTAELEAVRSSTAEPWFHAHSRFEIRGAEGDSEQILDGYGRTEEEAILATVNRILDRFESRFQSGRSASKGREKLGPGP